MKAKGMILSAIIALIGVLGVNAQDIIPVDSVHLLNKEQKKVLQYSKILAKKIKNMVELPIELNNLFPNNFSKEYHKSSLQMNNAYFLKQDKYEALLCIPTIAQIDSTIVESVLKIALDENDNYHRIVYSTFETGTDDLTEYLCLKSNIAGTLLSTIIFNETTILAEIDAKGYPWGVVDSPNENNFDLERRKKDEKYRYTHTRGANYYKNSALKTDGYIFTDSKGKVHFY